MPKSSSLTWPSTLTSTLAGLRSRCTIRLACAWATASSTSRNRRRRASMPERVLVAIAVDGLAVDVLEHEIRLAGRRDAGVDEVRDVRVGEPGEDGAFAPESLFAGAADQRDVQQLDRRAAFEAAVAALGEPDAAHPALADRARSAGRRRASGRPATRQRGARRQRHGAFEKASTSCTAVVLREQRPQIGGEGRRRAREATPARPARCPPWRSRAPRRGRG